ncbi:MAG: hypothetical protein HC811_14420 [Flammeovirgaceae bacterium]|nr:hypothetical protein [Flammeovirgaceae bacterium]
MVTYNPKLWFSIIFHSYSRHVMRTLMPAMTFMALYTGIICFTILDWFRLHEGEFSSTVAVHSILGIVLGLFLVFRINSAYDRWWEGRKLWGSMVNNTRNLSHKIKAFLSEAAVEDRKWFALMIPNFVFSVKEHLRKGVDMTELDAPDAEFENQLKGINHVPNKLSTMMYERVNKLYHNKELTGDQLFMVDKELKEFSDILGACERIRNTPIPYNYSMFIKKFIFIYIITLPLGFVTNAGYSTILIVVLVTFILLSVELIAEEIENPFGTDPNDLPTDELAVKIKDNVREILL